MSIITSPNAMSNSPSIRYPSLAALQAAHNGLLQRQRQEADTPAFLADVASFLREGTTTGALLDADADRRTAQGLLDYWVARLYRVGVEPPDATLAEFDPTLAPELPNELCPYLGLDAFREADGDKFFGRSDLIARLIEQLADQRLLAVVGPSGSGKSSLVRAGLIPALKRGALPGSEHWRYLPPIVPGSDPMASLDRILRTENQEPRTAVDASVLGSPTVLVVDQFEELFTLCEDDHARQAFVTALRGFIDTPEPKNRLILTMRSDFETFIARAPELQARFNQSRVQVTPLSAAELRESIEQPAEHVGLKFQAGVVDLLLQDILGEPAGLPLLQFTLLKLWENRERNRVTRATYDKVGGGRLALARSADTFYAGLIPEEQVTARRLLLRMIRPGEGLEITSSRVRRADLYSGGEDPGRVDRVLAKLLAARLVRLTEGDLPGDAQVEVAHEALVRNWPTLVDWLEEEKVALATRRRLESRAAEWVRLGQGSGGLLDEIELREAERWLESAEAQYLGNEPALPTFVAASRVAANQAAQEKETTRENKLRNARRYIIVLGILAVLAIFATGIALLQTSAAQSAAINAQQQRDIAETAQSVAQTAQAYDQGDAQTARTAEAQTQIQKQVVESQQLAFASDSQIQDAPEIALLLAYESAAHDDNRISQQTLRDGINHVAWVPTTLSGHARRVYSAVFSPDGQYILTASDDNTARLWDLGGKALAILSGHTGTVRSAAFSPDGQRILTASDDRTAQLWDTNGKPLTILSDHTGTVWSAVFSPDGQRILTASDDQTARLWDANGKPLVILSGHTGRLWSAVFSPNGQHILTASGDYTARLWDLNGKQLATLIGHKGAVLSAVFSPDGQHILTASGDHTARLWDLNGKQLATLIGHTNYIKSAVFSPDGQHILTASGDHTARLWDAAGRSLTALVGHTEMVWSAVFSPDGQHILTASGDHTARLWDAAGKSFTILIGPAGKVWSAVFSPDGQRILTASDDNTARLWNATDVPLAALVGHTAGVSSAYFSPDGRRTLTASVDGTVRLWDVNGKWLTIFKGHTAAVWSAVFSPDGKYILSVSDDQTARVWDVNGKQLTLLKGHSAAVRRAMFNPDGQYILTASDDQTARVWDVNGKQLTILKGHSAALRKAVFSPDGQYILTASGDQTARLWDLRGNVLAILSGHTDTINSAVFSLDSQYILTASDDQTARLWDLRGNVLTILSGHVGSVNSAVFSPNGQHILTASGDQTARLWDLRGNVFAILSGHVGSVTSAVFSPNSQHILTVSDDQTARLWDASAKPLATFRDHTDVVNSAVFSPSGQHILTASRDGTARQYLVNVDDLLKVAACRVSRGLTDEEIQRFQVPTPLKFDFAKRQCPPVLGEQK
jgi:WD40 repeat protein/energy-coupling factor transporter ATP-binding protein EcfA2